MEEQGTVTDLPRAGLATITIEKSPACEGCRSCCRGVGGAMVVEARDPIGVSVGERVLIAVPPATVLKASLVVYILPLVVLLAVGALAGYLARGLVPERYLQLVSVLAGLAGMLVAYFLLRRFLGAKAEETLRPTIKERV